MGIQPVVRLTLTWITMKLSSESRAVNSPTRRIFCWHFKASFTGSSKDNFLSTKTIGSECLLKSSTLQCNGNGLTPVIGRQKGFQTNDTSFRPGHGPLLRGKYIGGIEITPVVPWQRGPSASTMKKSSFHWYLLCPGQKRTAITGDLTSVEGGTGEFS